MTRGGAEPPVVLNLSKRPLLCARGALSELVFAAVHETPDQFTSAEADQSQALLRRCDARLAKYGSVAMTEPDVRLVRRAMQFVEVQWSMSDRQVLFGVDDSDWELTALLVDGAADEL